MRNTPEHSNVCRQPEQDGKRRRRTKQQVKKCAAFPANNGFLRKAFVPIISRQLGMLGQPQKIETEFYQSLKNLTAFYDLDLPDFGDLGYPLNVAKSFGKAKELFDKKSTGLELVILKNKQHKSCVTTVKTYNTGMSLFYVAVKPLYLLFNSPHQKAKANLLLSIFTYLYQVAGVPYFLDGFLGSEYDMIYEWYTNDPADYDETDYNEIMESFRVMNYFGAKLLKSIRHKYHLQQFQNRVQHFIPKTPNDGELQSVGIELLNIYLQCPDRSIFKNIQNTLIGTPEEDRILPDQYISFFWDDKGAVYEQLMETINVSFQEISGIDEPTAIQCFDHRQDKESHDLEFENKFFNSLGNLSDVLNDI